jgi:hypothetical protein
MVSTTGEFIHSNFLDLIGEEREAANDILDEFGLAFNDGTLISAYFDQTSRNVTICVGDTEIIMNLDEWFLLHYRKKNLKPKGRSERAERDWREDVLKALQDIADTKVQAIVDEVKRAEDEYNDYLSSPRKDMKHVSKMGNDLYKLRCRSVRALMKLGIPEQRAVDLLVPFFHDRH